MNSVIRRFARFGVSNNQGLYSQNGGCNVISVTMKKFRKQKRLTQKELAAAVGVSMTQIFLIEAGKYKPTALTLLKIARVLGADAGELLEPYDELD